jgi:Cd2+/Zn2+-exporting ATPase
VVGGLPIFRAALGAVRARHLDMNVLMSAAAVGAAGIGAWGEAASVVVLFAAGNALQIYAIDRTREAVRLSRAAEQIIKQNITASLLIKGVFVVLAPFGLVTLWLAVLADMGTSIAVTLNGLRLFNRERVI